MRGFLLRRCRLASSAASFIEGTSGESSEESRFRRPDTARKCGLWAKAGRVVRFGVAKIGGPLNDSTFWSVPFEDRRELWRFLCCEVESQLWLFTQQRSNVGSLAGRHIPGIDRSIPLALCLTQHQPLQSTQARLPHQSRSCVSTRVLVRGRAGIPWGRVRPGFPGR
jgi:hypothetical protein